MAIREIILEGDPTLLKKSRPVKRFNDRLATLVDDMIETMCDSDGVGLAAPQVGVLRRLFVMDIGDEDDAIVFVNPEIIHKEGLQRGVEGCLSLPGLVGVVSRPLSVTVRAQDVEGDYFEKTFTGLSARCICHETDHLDGILYRRRSETVLCTREEFEEEEQRKRAERERAAQQDDSVKDDVTSPDDGTAILERETDEKGHHGVPENEVST
ncbi:MAG TPA: peptide deformylase [Clostridiaceae bacterium]|jgi:peptide deformylase|nr:peptide deformylase [Clostridiaceae bacterium]